MSSPVSQTPTARIIQDMNKVESTFTSPKKLMRIAPAFLIVGAIAFIVLWWFKPALLQKKNTDGKPSGEVNGWLVLAASVIIAIVLLAIYIAFFGN